jgi:phosphoribosylanthranilate isomerase
MTRVKICGITCENDINYLNEYLPEYAGFVFAPSRRRVTADRVRSLTARLDTSIKKVGVFVNMPVEELVETAVVSELSAVQLHGEETPLYIEGLRRKLAAGTEIWKAFRVKDESSLGKLAEFKSDRFLMDAYVEGIYGGAGKSFDWTLVQTAGRFGSVILAGGLRSENVYEAIRIAEPFAVDVSSGVEIDGSKDEAKIREFISKVRST